MKSTKLPVIDVKKYGGKQIAIMDGKIVGSDEDTRVLVEEVQKKFPQATWREILLVSVPKGLTVIYKI